MSARSSHPGGSAARQDKIPELSCEACNERKVRCDKGNPCSTCQATGVVCVPTQRKRLPRGRHVKENKENKELRERLARLESLIGSSSTSTSSRSASSNLISTPGTPAPSALSVSGVFASGPGLGTGTGTGTGPGPGPGPGPGAGPGASISYPSPGPSADTSSLIAAAAATSHNYYPPSSASTTTSSAPSTFPSSFTGTEPTKQPASPRPRYLANAFWHDLVDKVCTQLALPPVPCASSLWTSIDLLLPFASPTPYWP